MKTSGMSNKIYVGYIFDIILQKVFRQITKEKNYQILKVPKVKNILIFFLNWKKNSKTLVTKNEKNIVRVVSQPFSMPLGPGGQKKTSETPTTNEKLTKAFHYAKNHKEGFRIFLEDGRLVISNNLIESLLQYSIQSLEKDYKNYYFIIQENSVKNNNFHVYLFLNEVKGMID